MKVFPVQRLLATVLLFVYALLVKSNSDFDGHHECMRTCEWPLKPRTCIYNWSVEWFHTLGPTCLIGCPNSTLPNPNNVGCHQDKDCILLNGASRPVAVVNRSLPGPTIQVCEYDTIVVHVTNNMDDSEEGTGIHWHGMQHYGTPHMDGVSMITQCPILIHQTFTYRFTATPPGTHWWHSHIGVQRADGVFGPLVVRQALNETPNSDQYDYDLSEHIIMVHDWFNTIAFPRFSAFIHKEIFLVADAILMNGKGEQVDGVDEASFSEHATFNVVPGNRYRFRVISNAIIYCQLRVSIDHHTLTLIALDGRPVEPFDTTAFDLHSSERFDFVLNSNQNVGNYWLRVLGLAECEGLQNLGIIHYEGAPEENPTEDNDYLDEDDPSITIVNKCQSGTEPETSISIMELNSKGSYETPKKADVTHHIAAVLGNAPSPGSTFNKVSFKMPSSPLLYQWRDIDEQDFCYIGNYPANCSEIACKCIHTIKFNTNQVIELVFINVEGNAALVPPQCHPMHIHGHIFHIVAQEFMDKPISIQEFIELDRKGLIPRKLNSAPRRDTAFIPIRGYLIVRFIADNPGWWFLHCHTELHLLTGMSLVLQAGEDNELDSAPDGFPQCGSWPKKSDVPVLSASADLSTTGTSSTRTSSTEVGLIIVPVVVGSMALGFLLNLIVIKHRKPDNRNIPSERVSLLYSGPT